MSKREAVLLALACTFIGIVMGFAWAPIKKGMVIYCGNNNKGKIVKKDCTGQRPERKKL